MAITPLLLLIALFVGYGFMSEVSQWGLVVVFLIVSAYALMVVPGLRLPTKASRFWRGATHRDLLVMVWIFVLAGAFTETAREMGAVDATVNLALHLLPPHLIFAGLFLAACFISLSMGTSVGTIVALVPVAGGLADKAGLPVAMLVAIVVGGAFFGDNLSFISDTTIMATRTQGCSMRDKFRANVRIVLPAALLTLILYVVMGSKQEVTLVAGDVVWLRVVPYLSVLLFAVFGVNVLIVLLVGCLLTGGVGLATGSYDLADWAVYACRGIMGMAPLISVSLLAGGLLNLVKHGGGIVYLMRLLTRRIHTPRCRIYHCRHGVFYQSLHGQQHHRHSLCGSFGQGHCPTFWRRPTQERRSARHVLVLCARSHPLWCAIDDSLRPGRHQPRADYPLFVLSDADGRRSSLGHSFPLSA